MVKEANLRTGNGVRQGEGVASSNTNNFLQKRGGLGLFGLAGLLISGGVALF